MQTQPNFEAVKKLFYQTFVDSKKATDCVLMQGTKALIRRDSFHTKLSDFKKDFNSWLDTVDIRQVGALIDECVKAGASAPKWMKNKKYTIEYNQHDALDLIIIKTENI